jgi:hypothetical protein
VPGYAALALPLFDGGASMQQSIDAYDGRVAGYCQAVLDHNKANDIELTVGILI